jgi:hypothetical protein
MIFDELEIDGDRRRIAVASGGICAYSPNWSEWFGSCGPRIGVHAWTHPSGVSLVDFHDLAFDGAPTHVSMPDIEAGATIWPGAGAGFILGLQVPLFEIIGATPPPVQHDVTPGGHKLPDKISTGDASSPRNSFIPRFRDPLSKEAGFGPVHAWAGLYEAFQLRRRYQRFGIPNKPPTKNPMAAPADDFGFRIDAFHEDQYPAGSIPGAKHWPKEKMDAWSPKHGVLSLAVDTFAVTHLAVQELATIFRLTRSPRSYDQARRLILSLDRWQWGVAPGIGTRDYGQTTRAKGRVLECHAYGIEMAVDAKDHATEATFRMAAADHVEQIRRLWALERARGNVTPSATPPTGHHLTSGPWDCAFFVAVLGWGAGLLARLDVPGAKELANDVCDCLAEHFRSGDTWFLDLPATGDKGEGAPYTKDGVGTGTFSWLPYAFIAADRAGDPFCVDAVALCSAKGITIENPFPATPEKPTKPKP